MALDNLTLEGEASNNVAAMIRAAGGSTVSITRGSSLLSHDNAVLKLSDGTLSTSPLQPENVGYYPVVQLNPGEALTEVIFHLRIQNIIINCSFTRYP